jgi:hypothetical protein
MQCPNCKFYKVDTELSFVDDGTVASPQIGEALLLPVVMLVIWAIGGAVMGAILQKIPVLFVVLFVVWTIGCLVYCIREVVRLLKWRRPTTKRDGYSHECRHCGYIWFSK